MKRIIFELVMVLTYYPEKDNGIVLKNAIIEKGLITPLNS